MAQVAESKFRSEVKPDWCASCGDFAVLSSLIKALATLGKEPRDVAVVSGIGCSSNLPNFIKTFGFHSLHGRAIPVATGVKLGNPNLNVVVTGGDGDGYGIGVGHFIHAMRRNIDLTYIVMDNQIYGLTTGQVSPTSMKGHKTKTTPKGNLEEPINPIALALAGGATFIARAFSGDPNSMTQTIADAIKHKGFSLVDVFSPCVTFNKLNTYDYFRSKVYKLQEKSHDVQDFHAAMDRAFEGGDKIPLGTFWDVEKPVLDEAKRMPGFPVPSDWQGDFGIPEKELQEILAEFL